MSAEISDTPEVKVLSPETIIKERQAAAAKQQMDPIPDSPMDAATNDVLGHPSDSFNTMASKLEKFMKEAMDKKEVQKDKSAGPDDSDKKRTDSKAKAPVPAAPEAKAPLDAAPAPELPEHITGAKAADWKLLKELKANAEKASKEWEDKFTLTSKEYDEFRKKVADPSHNEAFKKQLDELKSERDKLETKLREVDIEKSDSFNSFYKEKFDDAIARAKDAAGSANADRVEQLLSLPPSKWRKERLNEILDELEGVDITSFGSAVSDYDSVRREREAQIKDTKKNYERVQQIEADKQEQQRKIFQQRTEAAMASVLSVAEATTESFKKKNDKEHDLFVEESREYVKAFFNKKLPEHEVALLPVLAREARRYSEHVVPSLQKKIAELETALSQYRGASPQPSTGSRDMAAAASNNKPMGFIDIFNREWPAGNK